MPTKAEIAACTRLAEPDVSVYATDYARKGFQGGLNWYRMRTSGRRCPAVNPNSEKIIGCDGYGALMCTVPVSLCSAGAGVVTCSRAFFSNILF
jgi:hypothetical protein